MEYVMYGILPMEFEAIITLTTPCVQSKLGSGKMQASLHLAFFSYLYLFCTPHPLSLPAPDLFYSVLLANAASKPPVSYPCSPAVDSPSA